MDIEDNSETIIDEIRRIFVPQHRRTPLKQHWAKVYRPLVEQLKLQVRYNISTSNVEIKTCSQTIEPGAIQKAEDYLKAFVLGFDIQDAIALLRLDSLYVETFDITDVKPLKGEHLSRAIGRIAGSKGKMRYSLENATKTRIVIADSRIHILGSYDSIQVARSAISDLILGSGPSKTIGNISKISAKLNSKF